jgi:prepilin signal peptidase PulO-like enzyme (type II secretory pathway)
MESFVEAVVAALVGVSMGQLIDLYWGSFYSGEPIVPTPARCLSCRAPSSFPALLPFVAGVTWDEGRCPNCAESLNLRSVYLPAGASLLFLLSYWAFDGNLGAALLGGFFATIFLTLTLTDLESRLLPNRIVYPGILLAIVFCWGWPDTSWWEILAGGGVAILIALAMLLISLPFGADALGMGDVKMIVLMGFVLGFPSVIVGVVLGTLAAGVVAALLLVTGRAGRRDYIPHGPFLAFGAIVALFWGNDLWPY